MNDLLYLSLSEYTEEHEHMSKENSIFSIEDLLAKIKEAESLQVQLMELLTCDDKLLRNAFALRWAVVADDATDMILRLEEVLPEEQLLSVRQVVDCDYPGCWEGYRDNTGRFARLYDETT